MADDLASASTRGAALAAIKSRHSRPACGQPRMARLGAEGPGGQPPPRFAPFRVIRGCLLFWLSQADNQVVGICEISGPNAFSATSAVERFSG